MIASTESAKRGTAGELRAAEIERRARIVAASPSDDPFVRIAGAAADQFIVRRGDERTVIAGYHWFSDWGRDTMIALPGLTLVTGRYDVAKSILLAFAAAWIGACCRIVFPTRARRRSTTPSTPRCGSSKRSARWWRHTGDYEFVRTRLYDRAADIIAWHERGTRYGIRVDE